MNDYLLLKWLHVLSATLLFGTGIGSAWYLWLSSLSRDARVVASVSRHVVWADTLFTATTVVVQPVTGIAMARLAGWPLSTPWLRWSIVLYALAVACWLPVVVLQIRMHRVSAAAAARDAPLPPAYRTMFRAWMALGVPALVAFLAIFWLMVAKPA